MRRVLYYVFTLRAFSWLPDLYYMGPIVAHFTAARLARSPNRMLRWVIAGGIAIVVDDMVTHGFRRQVSWNGYLSIYRRNPI